MLISFCISLLITQLHYGQTCISSPLLKGSTGILGVNEPLPHGQSPSSPMLSGKKTVVLFEEVDKLLMGVWSQLGSNLDFRI